MPRQEDIEIGARIKQRRLVLKLTQTEVAEAIGVRFQQLQKYETGINRVSASRLVDLGKALDVPPSYFFEGFGNGVPEDEIKSAAEVTLLQDFRRSSESARSALLRIAQETAQACA